MSRTKTILSVIVFLIIGALYLWIYGGAFKKPVINLSYSVRPGMGGRRTGAGRGGQLRSMVTFSLTGEYKLTSVRVVAEEDLKTNKFPHPLWQLTANPASAPVRIFIYGVTVRGMQTLIPDSPAEPLATNVPYRVFVEAGRVKGQRDFIIKGEEPPAQ